MLSRSRARIAIGSVLLAIILLGAALSAGRTVIRQTHRHVVVEVFNLNSVVQVFVNCRQAGVLGREQAGGTFDLGWLEPDDRVFLSATSRDDSPSYGFTVFSNGAKVFQKSRGDAEVLGFPAEANAVVFAEALSAGGAALGQIGCQPAAVVAIPNYVRSGDDQEVPRIKGAEPAYEPPRSTFDRIDAAGRWSLIPLAILGLALAAGIAPIRKLIVSHWKLAGSALASLATIAGLFLGVLGAPALVTTLTLGGTLLLFAVALLLLLPVLWRGLEDAGEKAS